MESLASPTTVVCVAASIPLGMTKRAVKKTVGSAPLASRALTLCHVERICQSGSDRDISYHFCPGKIEEPLFESRDSLDAARNDKDAEAVGGATGPHLTRNQRRMTFHRYVLRCHSR